MNIRVFQDRDYLDIVAIYNKSKMDELCLEVKAFILLPLEKDNKRLADLKESDIYVYDDGDIRGFGALFENEIRALFVKPDSRGNRIGKSLLEYLLSQTNRPVNLFLVKTNKPAKQLYKSYGFEVVREFQTTYNGVSVCVNEMVLASNRVGMRQS